MIQTVTAPGDAKYIGGVSYVISDTEKLTEVIRKMEAGESFEATKSAEATGVAGTTAPVVSAKDVTVTVRNGAGTKGLALEVSTILKGKAFNVKEVGNTARPVYPKTLIVFKTDDAKAKLVHDTLGFGEVVKSKSLYQFDTDVLVVVGKDWRVQFPTPASQ
jgi:hypothetical protein